MARKPRPIDPTEGPLQAFAYDLREVREEAGNPTYRALAGRAGFSATTLSDAAGGVRQPSLEVTLAYVGACGGDVDRWKHRWHELDRELAAARGEPPARPDPEPAPEPATAPGSGPGSEPGSAAEAIPGPAPTPGPAQDARQNGRDALENGRDALENGEEAELGSPSDADGDPAEPGRSRRWPAVLAAVVLAVAIGVSALVLPKLIGGSAPAASMVVPPCADYAGPVAFTGRTYGTVTRVRQGPSLNADSIAEYPPGCAVSFSGFCLGDVIKDMTSNTPDMRWFKVSGGGVISSGVIHGNPPKGMQPEMCQGGSPMPSSISMTASQPGMGSDAIDLGATGTDLGIVGFAGYFTPAGAAVPGPKWQQIGFVAKSDSGFSSPWRLGPLRSEIAERGGIPVVAVACLGGEGPTDTVDVRLYRPGVAGELARVELAAAEQAVAARAACAFPREN
ncbi:helix-turn-helix transcriptional regulator [Kitasatospora sp. NBC_00374]|uniref:helix-turn-helix domain-containing protein n=1 Tax=Kitasatospora sp. NBC_00374 TaxID=2975964 RepID=UPI0032485E19